MTRPHIPDRAVLERIGDETLLLIDGTTPHAIKQWKYRGVPWRFRALVAKLAKTKRIVLPPDFVETRT